MGFFAVYKRNGQQLTSADVVWQIDFLLNLFNNLISIQPRYYRNANMSRKF